MVGGGDEGAGQRDSVKVQFAGWEGDECGREEEHGQGCIVEEGVVRVRHGFALGESRVGGFGHSGGLGRGGRIVGMRGEDGIGGFIDRESRQCSVLPGMVELGL